MNPGPLMIDSREVIEHPQIPELFKIPILVNRMNAGDYAFLDRNEEPTGIERCEIGNLLQKIRSGELEQQILHCDRDYSHVILLTERVYDEFNQKVAQYKEAKTKKGSKVYIRTRIESGFRYREVEAFKLRLAELGIEQVWTPNLSCTIDMVELIYLQRTKPEEAHTLFKKIKVTHIPVKLSNNPNVPKLMALCPRIPEKVAIALIYKYETIWNIINTPDKELLEVDGFGQTLLDRLKEGVGK